MRKYTVVGYYEDTGEVWVEHVEAETPYDAFQVASRSIMAFHDLNTMALDNIAVVEAFLGHHKGQIDGDNVAYACDLLERSA